MRKVSICCFTIALVTIIAGAVFAYYDFLIDWDNYKTMVAIVGSIASILLGLLGFVINPIQQYRSDKLRELAETAEEVEKKQEKLKEANDQINELTIKKNELETLVEKASLSIYYKKELEKNSEALSKFVESNETLKKMIDDIQQLEKDLKNLNCEIDQNDNIKNIINTIQKANYLKTRRLLSGEYEIRFFGGTITFKLL